VWGEGADTPFVAGRLVEAFHAAEGPQGIWAEAFDISTLHPGDRYPGPPDKKGGTYRLRQKYGGVIERPMPSMRVRDNGADTRRRSHDVEFAIIDGTGYEKGQENARRVLDAWRQRFERGITFYVNSAGDAWYVEGGDRRFLAHVPGGFSWASSRVEDGS